MQKSRALVWFRRDLRDFDHAALHHALKNHEEVFCAFIFDRAILDALIANADRRVEFIWESIAALSASLVEKGGALIVQHAFASEAVPALAKALAVKAVYANHDYEPAAIARDEQVRAALRDTCGADFLTFKDQVIFEKSEVFTQSGTSFSVFTPYKNAWLRALTPEHLKAYSIEKYQAHFAPQVLVEKALAIENPAAQIRAIPSLESMGFVRTNLKALRVPLAMQGGAQLFDDYLTRIDRYANTRNFPAVKGPSYLSVHLRFGTVSIRHLARVAHHRWIAEGSQGAGLWLSELIWRDFYFQILHHHPHVVSRCFKPVYDALAWRNDPAQFTAWCAGNTGFPIIDAAMRQLNQTGYMHNRLRMIVASFLTKDLQIDWRWGEKYFAEQLIDFDLSANSGGWQWAASTGCDAQPYFRIFNPISQSEKFDEKGQFIRKYVPEIAALSDNDIHAPWLAKPLALQAAGVQIGKDYPAPLVSHNDARELTLRMFAQVRS